MAYTAKDYSGLTGIEGMSEALLKNHFTLYQGYVTNTNKLLDLLSEMARNAQVGTPGYAELKRRFGWEFNGMRLHEYYFDNIAGAGAAGGKPDMESPLVKRAAAEFGSFEAWEKDFRSASAMRGIGWVVLYEDAQSGRLFNCWINEHDAGHPAGCDPILVMDVFEHAYMLDYGLKRADYIEAFFKNINWRQVERRLK